MLAVGDGDRGARRAEVAASLGPGGGGPQGWARQPRVRPKPRPWLCVHRGQPRDRHGALPCREPCHSTSGSVLGLSVGPGPHAPPLGAGASQGHMLWRSCPLKKGQDQGHSRVPLE